MTGPSGGPGSQSEIHTPGSLPSPLDRGRRLEQKRAFTRMSLHAHAGL